MRLAVIVALPLLALGGVRRLSPFQTPAARRGWSWYLAVDAPAAALRLRRRLRPLRLRGEPGQRDGPAVPLQPRHLGADGLGDLPRGARRARPRPRRLGRLPPRARCCSIAPRRWPPAPAPRAPARRSRRPPSRCSPPAALYGKLSWYPLRWSDAYFSTSTFAADLAHNPVLYFAETLRKKPAAYDLAKVRAAYPLRRALPRPRRPRPGAPRLRAPRRARCGAPPRRPNVVIVLLESFAAYKTGAFGNPLDPTPRFDALAREGTLYTRFYTPTWGTARSVWATVTGLPDVETHLTATRNPLIVAQHTILNDFAGYEKLYFLGGSLNWANIRGLLAANIDGLRLFEEGSYSAPRVDVWGISDLDLFEEANRVFSGIGKPFVAIVQTSGSHRPYTIPKNRRGFEPRPIADAEARRHGFVSADEFNAFRFLDHAIGVFIDGARREPWFADTIFLFYGDHGLPGSAPHIPRGRRGGRPDALPRAAADLRRRG